LRFDETQRTDLFVDADQVLDALLETMKFGNLFRRGVGWW
jgi:hypothetical protein